MTVIKHNPPELFPPYRCYSHATEIRDSSRLLIISGLNGYSLTVSLCRSRSRSRATSSGGTSVRSCGQREWTIRIWSRCAHTWRGPVRAAARGCSERRCRSRARPHARPATPRCRFPRCLDAVTGRSCRDLSGPAGSRVIWRLLRNQDRRSRCATRLEVAVGISGLGQSIRLADEDLDGLLFHGGE